VRLLVNWTPTDPLTFTFFVDSAQDDYSNRDGSSIGPQKGRAQNFSVDAAYTFNDQWQATAWYTRGDIKADQKTCVGAASNGVCGTPTYGATVKNTSDNFGLGFRGRPTAAFEIGADFTYSDIKDEYQQNALIGSPIASLPNVSTKQTRLNLYGKYALQKNSGIRLDYVFDRYSTDDWLWSTWMYADGTRLQDPNQKVNFIGVSYYYKWQ